MTVAETRAPVSHGPEDPYRHDGRVTLLLRCADIHGWRSKPASLQPVEFLRKYAKTQSQLPFDSCVGNPETLAFGVALRRATGRGDHHCQITAVRGSGL